MLKISLAITQAYRPRPRTPGTELRFKALGEVASYLKRSRLYPGASSLGHGEPSTDVPEADALLRRRAKKRGEPVEKKKRKKKKKHDSKEDL